MPEHVYRPANTPPTWWDRVLVHPFENMVSAFCVIFGGLLVTQAVAPSPSIDEMPWWVAILLGFTVAAGGVISIIGLHWDIDDDDDLLMGWSLDILGHYLQAGALLGFSTSIMWFYPGSVASWLAPLLLAIASVLRVIAVRRIKATSTIIVHNFRKETNGNAGE